MRARELPLMISWFPSAVIEGRPALGDPERTTWGAFTEVFASRREGEKDGPCFSPSRYVLEPDGRHVRRKLVNAAARTAIALDIEPSKATGEVPPGPQEALKRLQAAGLAGVVYTSHSYQPERNIRYRVVCPLSAEIRSEIPAADILAKALRLNGVLDAGKVNAAAVFYCPSCEDEADEHYCKVIDGEPVDAAWVLSEGTRILEAEHGKAQAAAAARLAARAASGFSSEDSLIEKIRPRLDLESLLISHGYEKLGDKFKHPNSSSGSFGANIKTLGGIERVFSHNATDPLHGSNLPEWCKKTKTTAIDAFDVAAILDFSGDRKKALRGLAERFNFSKAAEKKTLAGTLFRLIRQQAAQTDIEAAAIAESGRLGLSREEVNQVALWVCQQSITARRTA